MIEVDEGWLAALGSLAVALGGLLQYTIPRIVTLIQARHEEKRKDKDQNITIEEKQRTWKANSYQAFLANYEKFMTEMAQRLDRSEKEMESVRSRLFSCEEDRTTLKAGLAVLQGHVTDLESAQSSRSEVKYAKTLDKGYILFWTAGAERILGWTEAEAVGRSVYDLLIPPELHEQERQWMEKIRQGQSIDHQETERLHREGYHVQLRMSVTPIRSPGGEIVGALTVARKSKPKTQEIQVMGS